MRIVVLSDGLTGSLVSLAIRKQQSNHEFLMIQIGEGSRKTCFLPFCDSAVPDRHRWLIEPLIARRWDSFYLSFRAGADLINGTVSLLAREQIHAELFDSLGPGQFLRTGKIVDIGACHVVLEDGRKIDADHLIDARERRGATGAHAGRTEISIKDYLLDQPHGLDAPVLLDATLPSPPHLARFLQYIPLSKNLLRVSYARHEPDHQAKSREILPSQSNGIRLVGENSIWISSSFLLERSLDSSNPDQSLPAYLDGLVISAFKNSAWNAVEGLRVSKGLSSRWL